MLNIIRDYLVGTPKATLQMVQPIPVLTTDLVQFRRTTKRYGKIGTFSNNQGYLMSNRNPINGQFAKVNQMIDKLGQSMAGQSSNQQRS